MWLGRKILRRDQLEQQDNEAVHYVAAGRPAGVNWAQTVPAPQAPPVGADGKLPLSETSMYNAGGASPFGDDQSFPLEPDQLRYHHPQSKAE